MARDKQQFTTIRSEGALLPPDILVRIAAQKVDGLKPVDFHLPEGFKITESISQSWELLKKHWAVFQEARQQLEESQTGTTLTNDRWLLPLFRELDYGHLTTVASPVIEERSYPITRFYNNTPIHLIGCNLSLDKRTKGAQGAATSSPHSMVQEYLNRSDAHLWAFVSNGRQLRILRDNVALSRQAYIEFDLEGMMEGEVYSDFVLLWMLCHQSRVESPKPEDCWLEQWSKLAREEGTRVLNDLRSGVTNAIEALGAGFIAHPQNDQLRSKLQESGSLSRDEYYRQLLRIVYRLLFLFVAEDRQLLHPTDVDANAAQLYDQYYSTARLRELCLKMRGSKHSDLWHSLSLVFSSLANPDGCSSLGLVGLGSFLWRPSSVSDLMGPNEASDDQIPVHISNQDLLSAIRALAFVEKDRVLRSVDYRNLGSEELGSVYEALLELHPTIHVEARRFELGTAAGNERKTSGSYYTPDSLVQCLLDSALDPVVEDRLKGKKGKDAEDAILGMKVCDPACGSGHFLIAAAHRMARHLARIRTGDSEPSPEHHQHALRDIIGKCIYGVDINPMAVELCKVSLWMEAIEPGKPLSFLDHHIQCGNSLLGTTPRLLGEGIPDDAFKPIEGDDKSICSELKADNKRQRRENRTGQSLFAFEPANKLGNVPATFAKLSQDSDDSVSEVASKEKRYADLVTGADYQNARLLADTWCGVFVWKKDKSELGKLCPTETDFRKIESNPHSILPHVRDEVRRLANQYQFFHWHLAFPDVFELPREDEKAENEQTGWSRGFDCLLGNPPWEKIKLEEKEWFASSHSNIARAPGAKRKRLIAELEEAEPQVFAAYKRAIRLADGFSHFFRDTGAYPLCSKGDINCFSLFVELVTDRLNPDGRIGCVVPSGIATDNTTKLFLQKLVDNEMLAAFFDFWNRKQLFKGVQPKLKFCMLSISRKSVSSMRIAAQLEDPSQLRDPEFVYSLTREDVVGLNPNTRNLPTFASARAARLAIAMHRKNPILIHESEEPQNPHNVEFYTLFHSTNDSDKFHTHDELINHGAVLQRNQFIGGETSFVPVLEAKLVHQYNHRASTFPARSTPDMFKIHAGTNPIDVETLAQPFNTVLPRYWMSNAEASKRRIEKAGTEWLVGFRRTISAVADARSVVFTVLPPYATTDSLFMTRFDEGATSASSLIGVFNSFAFDFSARQKASGGNLSFYVFKQLPLPTPKCLKDQSDLVLPRVLELTYTAWDLEAFALDCGYEGPPFRWDEERRFLLRCELDAAYFHLYLGSPNEWGTDNPELREMFPTPRDAVDYIMETFPIVKRKDIARTEIKDTSGNVTTEGNYITKDTILRIYDQMQTAIETGVPYQTQLSPPPGPPTDQEGNFIPMALWDSEIWRRYKETIHQPRRAVVTWDETELARDLLVLLEVWNSRVSFRELEAALLLMRDEKARDVLKGTGAAKPALTGNSTHRISGITSIYDNLEMNGLIKSVGDTAFEIVNSEPIKDLPDSFRQSARDSIDLLMSLDIPEDGYGFLLEELGYDVQVQIIQ